MRGFGFLEYFEFGKMVEHAGKLSKNVTHMRFEHVPRELFKALTRLFCVIQLNILQVRKSTMKVDMTKIIIVLVHVIRVLRPVLMLRRLAGFDDARAKHLVRTPSSKP